MYKITWDEETGGVLLNTTMVSGTLGISPRPVFFEELDLIGLDKLGWSYPRCAEPIMWAVNKQYWYRGQHLFDAKGANIYTKPTLEMMSGVTPMALQAVDVEAMLERTKELMSALESEAIYFIRETFDTYSRANKTYAKAEANKLDFDAMAERAGKKTGKKMVTVRQDCDSFDVMPLSEAERQGKRVLLTTKIDRFIASFSGGKDSQVVLDLCTRAIPPSDFEVIYSDTGYELPPSLELYEQVQEHYHKLYPSLKFHTARNHESVLNYWDKIGTPSDTHRWCCSIMKTAPLYRMLLAESDKKAKFLAFEGVRAEESVKRSDYDRIGKGVKHRFVINARPILLWNTVEVFLYLFAHKLHINHAYRVGKPRVGCILCPFGSPWDDMIVKESYPDKLRPFLSRIENEVDNRKIPNRIEYITERKWKLRSSGKFSKEDAVAEFITTNEFFLAVVSNAKKEIFTWLPIIGELNYVDREESTLGELRFKNEIFKFEIIKGKKTSDFSFKVYDFNNIQLRYLLRRVINKTTYCINCEACDIECPTGALSVFPEVIFNQDKCIRCYKCIDYHNTGCIVADSIVKPIESTNKQNMTISNYGTFGIHQEWVEHLLDSKDEFWNASGLGTKQVPSFKAWMKDAGIIDKNSKLTEFGELCADTYKNNPQIVWELIFINLAHNSPLIKWFISKIDFNKVITRKDLDSLALEYFQPALKASTITYAIQSLVQTFKYSPIGDKLRQPNLNDSKGTSFRREIYNKVSTEALTYSLYKYAESKKISCLRVSDIYHPEEEQGIYREFGIEHNEFHKKLRFLSSSENRVLIAELNMGLEHITLIDGFNAITAVRSLLA